MSLLSAFPPVATSGATVLVLGSMPGVKSLQENRYYAHPRNAFWPIMNACLSMDDRADFSGDASSYEQMLGMMQQHGIALWDVLKHCERDGSLDASIKKETVVCNDFRNFLKNYPGINTVLFNGKTSERLFRQHVVKILSDEQIARLSFVSLPSTSPAMAMLNATQKLERWRDALVQAGVLDTAGLDTQAPIL